jgi:hypothetical protein
MTYSVAALVEDLRASYGPAAPKEALGLMVIARDRGLARERVLFATAAILLCRSDAGHSPAPHA